MKNGGLPNKFPLQGRSTFPSPLIFEKEQQRGQEYGYIYHSKNAIFDSYSIGNYNFVFRYYESRSRRSDDAYDGPYDQSGRQGAVY